MASGDTVQRSSFPIPDLAYIGTVTYDATHPDTHYPPVQPIGPPVGAPNVLIVQSDDSGFGASSVFGGPVQTLNCERVAAAGLTYTRFHTTALCTSARVRGSSRATWGIVTNSVALGFAVICGLCFVLLILSLRR